MFFRSTAKGSRTIALLWSGVAIALLALTGCASTPSTSSSSGQGIAQTERGKVLTRTYDFKEAGKPVEYALYVPTGYNPKKATPLVVLLHGLTSNPLQVMGYEGIVEQAEKRGFIVVAPYGYNTSGWYGSLGQGKDFGRMSGNQPAGTPDNLGELSEKDVLNVLAIARTEFKIDNKRTYLMGHSMGGGGSFYLAMKYPNNWAALAPMSPAIYSSPDQLAAIRKIPIIVVQGDKDTLVSVNTTRQWIAKMAELKMPHKYIEIKDGNHVQSISKNPQMIAEVFDFLAAQKKK